MSQRLQSLSRGGRSRFLPKAVDRRSKEERESSAPAIKPNEESEKPTRKQERRKPKQLGIRAEAAGPLAAPSISTPAKQVRTGLNKQTKTQIKTEQDVNIDFNTDERIDIQTPKTALFPLRLPTNADLQSSIEFNDKNLVLFQLPPLGLSLGAPKPVVKSEDSFMEVENVGSSGFMGKLVRYKSGKMQLQLDSCVLDLSTANVGCVSELVDVGGGCRVMGELKGRVLCVPQEDI